MRQVKSGELNLALIHSVDLAFIERGSSLKKQGRRWAICWIIDNGTIVGPSDDILDNKDRRDTVSSSGPAIQGKNVHLKSSHPMPLGPR